jgi:hypothetical protein
MHWNNKLLLRLIFDDIGYVVWQFAKEEFFEVLALVEKSVFLVVNTAISEVDPNDPFA